ncbi:nitrite reductase small subunit NirD [Halopseudomonas sp.]|uniref:nitrite reductase small subunit NirD n=1 Tax=Halopseudomonas sp. TaxID=2901191 RepID=UPI003001CBC8
MSWVDICALDEIPPSGVHVVMAPKGDIAIFRTSANQVFALDDRCPHQGASLSQGVVIGNLVVCPQHNWQIQLDSGRALTPDIGCSNTYPARIEAGRVQIAINNHKDIRQ